MLKDNILILIIKLETEWFSVNYDNFDETIEKVFTYLNSK